MGNGTSIGRVRGLGSAKTGAHHWLVQRWTAIGNLVLIAYLAVSLLLLPGLDYQAVSAWIASPVPAVAVALLIVSTFWHARLGLQVFIEDYVHGKAARTALLLANTLLCGAFGLTGVFAVARIAFTG